MPEKRVGKVEHYYPKAKAAAVGLDGDLKVGDEIHIVGHGDDVRKRVASLQKDHVPIQEGHRGEHIGVGLAQKVHEGDDVYLVLPDGPASTWAPAKRAKAGAAAKPAAKPAKRGKAKPKAKAAKPAKRGKAKGRKAAKRPAARRGKAAGRRKAPARKAARAGKRKPARKAARKGTRKRR